MTYKNHKDQTVAATDIKCQQRPLLGPWVDWVSCRSARLNDKDTN